MGILLAAACVGATAAIPAGAHAADAPAPSGAAYVDGISDQNLSYWDAGSPDGPYFSTFFQSTWMAHIRLARLVVPWDVMKNAKETHHQRLASWYADVLAMGLIPDVALSIGVNGPRLPASAAEYEGRVGRLLDAFPRIRYLEAWNEPNHRQFDGGEGPSPAAAAGYWDEAEADCRTRDCKAIAGDYSDSDRNMVDYERVYDANLSQDPEIQAIHPYSAVYHEDASTVEDFKAQLRRDGLGGDQVWFTEVGAVRCIQDSRAAPMGERQQAADAAWLTGVLMPQVAPVHVFYYYFLDAQRRVPSCDPGNADTALYAPSPDPNVPDGPRAAAAFIFAGKGVPSAYTGPPATASEEQVSLAGTVYPGGLLDSRYHVEYGTSASYGSYSREGDAGAGARPANVRIEVSRLLPGTVYHYRLVAWNSEGAQGPSYGRERMFTTPERQLVSEIAGLPGDGVGVR